MLPTAKSRGCYRGLESQGTLAEGESISRAFSRGKRDFIQARPIRGSLQELIYRTSFQGRGCLPRARTGNVERLCLPKTPPELSTQCNMRNILSCAKEVYVSLSWISLISKAFAPNRLFGRHRRWKRRHHSKPATRHCPTRPRKRTVQPTPRIGPKLD